VEVVTPSGYKVYLKPYVNYGQKREIRKVLLKGYDTNNGRYDSSVLYEAQELAFKLLVDKVIDPEGKEYLGLDTFKFVQGLENEADGDAIYEKVEEISKVKGQLSGLGQSLQDKKK